VAGHKLRHKRRRASKPESAYTLIARGPDGRLRAERFTDVHAYRARLAALERSSSRGLSIDDIATLLDT